MYGKYRYRLRVAYRLVLWAIKFILFKPTAQMKRTWHDFFNEFIPLDGFIKYGDLDLDNMTEKELDKYTDEIEGPKR